MEDIVSIVVPVYNIKEYINKCIDSIVSQTYSKIETIIIDDGSSDGTEQIVDEYAKKYENITVYHTENKGVSAARNIGISKASGKWIIFIDGDDYVKSEYVETLVSLMKKNSGCNLAICNHCEVDNKGIIKGYNWFEKKDNEVISNNNMLLKKTLGISIEGESGRYFGTVWGKMYDVKIIIDNNISFYEQISVGEDILFNLNYMQYVDTACFYSTKLYVYRLRSRSASRENDGYSKYIDFFRYCTNSIRNTIDVSEQKALVDFVAIHTIYRLLLIKSNFRSEDIDYLLNLEDEFRYVISSPCFEFFEKRKKVLWLLIKLRMASLLRILIWIKGKKDKII